MNAQDIGRRLDKTLLRYKAGLIDIAQARQESFLLVAMLKAYEQTTLEEKLDRIETVLESRR